MTSLPSASTAHDIDLEAYFRRISYEGSRDVSLGTLNGIVARHTHTIPFENLDVLLGRGISLDPSAIEQKLVANRRGGYCFEHNTHLLRVLHKLGFSAVPIPARVLWQWQQPTPPPRTHVFLKVDLGGETWLADTDFGGTSPTTALRLETDVVQHTLHEDRRIVERGNFYVHQMRSGDNWLDLCEFSLEEMPEIDREVANWYTSTHPTSKFRNSLFACLAAPKGVRLTVFNNEFNIRDADGRANRRTIGSPEELLELLSQYFGLSFPPDTRFGDKGASVSWPV